MGPRIRGLFSPDDMLWKINRENLVMLSGSRALLLELAHPKVATGVAEHSDFRHRPLHRLFNTLSVMQRLSFGDWHSVQRSARHVYHCHAPVEGKLPSGDSYSSNDPELRLWVFATLIDSVVIVHDTLIRPLSSAEREAYYQDSKRMARMLGVQESIMPQRFCDFQCYCEDVIYGGTLEVTDTAREVAEALFGAPAVGPLLRIASWAGIGLLPTPIREGYELPWTERDQRWLDRLSKMMQRARSIVPEPIWVQPEALLGEVRRRFS